MSYDPHVVIRQLEFCGDVEAARRLLDTFGEVFEDADTYTRAQPSEGYLEGLLRSDHFIVLAALSGRCGGDRWILRPTELQEVRRAGTQREICYLRIWRSRHRIVVRDRNRSYRATQDDREGARRVCHLVQADLTDPAAIELYTKLGTGSDVLHFDIAVPSP